MREELQFDSFEALQAFIRGLEYVNIAGLFVETFHLQHGCWVAVVVDERKPMSKLVLLPPITRSQSDTLKELIAMYYDNFVGEPEGKFLEDVKALEKILKTASISKKKVAKLTKQARKVY
jgi:hypothetical protein